MVTMMVMVIVMVVVMAMVMGRSEGGSWGQASFEVVGMMRMVTMMMILGG